MPLYFFLIFHLLIFFLGELGLEVHMTLLKLYLVLPPCYPVLLYACMAVLDSMFSFHFAPDFLERMASFGGACAYWGSCECGDCLFFLFPR